MDKFSRSMLLLPDNSLNILKHKKIAIFGIGGVGSYVLEILARTGIENFVLVDNDVVSTSNINRQLIATNKTIGKYKVDVAKERILDINSSINVETHNTFVLNDTINDFNFNEYDYIIDAIDTISAKILLIEKAKEYNVPIISSMGTGNKLDPMKFKICDISKTNVCPLAKVMRYELRKRNIKNVKVLYSEETPIDIANHPVEKKLLESYSNKHQIPGSIAFVPSVAGILIAREVILDIIKASNL